MISVVRAGGGGPQIETKRFATGQVGAGATVNRVITWDTTFPDTNYTVVVTMEEIQDPADRLEILRIRAQSATDVTVRLVNRDGLAAREGTIHAIAVAD